MEGLHPLYFAELKKDFFRVGFLWMILFVGLFLLMFGAFFCSMKKYDYPVLVKEFNYLILLALVFSMLLVLCRTNLYK